MKNYYQIVDTFTAEVKGSSSLLQKGATFIWFVVFCCQYIECIKLMADEWA